MKHRPFCLRSSASEAAGGVSPAYHYNKTTNMITINTNDTHLALYSPFHPDLPSAAKKLGGKWDPTSRSWRFRIERESAVRALCQAIYGTDSTPSETVTLRVSFPGESEDDTWIDYDCALYVAGVQVARVLGRDTGAQISECAAVIEGRLGSSGSRKNPTIVAHAGTIVEVLDVPKRSDGVYEVPAGWTVTVVDTAANREALQEELAQLEARVAEIRKLLQQD